VVLVLHQAVVNRGTDREESIDVERLPAIGGRGGEFSMAELAAAYRGAAINSSKASAIAGSPERSHIRRGLQCSRLSSSLKQQNSYCLPKSLGNRWWITNEI